MSTAPPARPGGDVAAADGGVGKPAPEVTAANGNNSAAIGGYDAYFGLYVMDEAAGTVTHMLETALNPAGVGRSLVRQWPLSGDTLVIGFETTGPGGAPLTRVLTWRRER